MLDKYHERLNREPIHFKDSVEVDFDYGKSLKMAQKTWVSTYGLLSCGLKYHVHTNRNRSCFKDLAYKKYIKDC